MILKKKLNRKIIIGLLMIMIIIFVIAFAKVLVPNDPTVNNLGARFNNSNTEYPLGTDQLGRCILSRLIYGGYNTFSIVILVILLSAIISIIMGIISGYSGGILDKIITGIVDMFMAFPPFIYIIALMGIMGGSKSFLIISLILGSWAFYTKTIRTQVQLEKNKLYIKAAKIAGSSNLKIIIRHILPSILPNLLVFFSLQVGELILAISGFSFIGIGLPSDIPEWGNMIGEAKEYMFLNQKLMFYPGVCIFFTVFAFNLVAEGVREQYQV